MSEIPIELWNACERRLSEAYEATKVKYGGEQLVSGVLWEALIEASAEAVLHEKACCARRAKTTYQNALVLSGSRCVGDLTPAALETAIRSGE